MTNKEHVNEINRQIRGIALNYPEGLPAIRAQLKALEPVKVDTIGVGPEVVAALVAPNQTSWMSGALPDPLVPPVKRGPGRPKKIA